MRPALLKYVARAIRFCFVLTALATAPSLRAQVVNTPDRPMMPNLGPEHSPESLRETGPPNSILSPKYRDKLIADERRKKMVSDARHLLELAQALNDEVQKTSEDQLNVDVVRKAAEMEKLSRDLKERMSH